VTPTGSGFGSSRFSSPTKAFRVLNAANKVSTAFAEAVVRDRFEGTRRRVLYRPYLDNLSATTINSIRKLTLLDLTGAAAYELSRRHECEPRPRSHVGISFEALSEAIYAEMPDVGGILFNSRLTWFLSRKSE